MRLALLSAAWLAGTLLGLSLGLEAEIAWLLSGASALAAMGMWLARLPALPALLAMVLLLGMGRADIHSSQNTALDLLGQEVVASGQIADDPEATARQVRFELKVSRIVAGDVARDVDERWLVYAVPPDELVQGRTSPYFRYGDQVAVRGTPMQPQPLDGFDYAAYLSAQGITAVLFAGESGVTGEGGTWWRAAIYGARGKLAESLERSMPYPESALATAVVLGKRESLPTGLVEQFRGTGAAHLLAISGLHVGVLLAAAVGAAAWLLGRRRGAYLVVAGMAVWLYALLAGASPSALRAAVMGTVYLAALGLGRPSSVVSALALAAAVMTAASPNLIRQVSFQLSFAAVGGIALAHALLGGRFSWGTTPASGWVGRLAGWTAGLLTVSAAATLATWPLVALNFGQVALLGVPVSLLAIPAVAPLIVLAMLSAATGVVLAPLGELLGWVAAAPASWLIGVVSIVPTWTVDAEGVGRPLILLWYLGLGGAVLAASPRRARLWRRWAGELAGRLPSLTWRLTRWVAAGIAGGSQGGPALPHPYMTTAIAIGLAIAAAVLWLKVSDGPDGILHVHFLDIGQGDSTLIVTPSGKQVLVDGGPDGDVTSGMLAASMPSGDRSLDLVVITHFDSDHSHGLLQVMDRYVVGALVTGPLTTAGGMGPQWEQSLERQGLSPLEVRAGHTIRLEEGVQLTVLNPPADRLFADSNNDSVALRLVYGSVSVLLSADMEGEAERRLVSSDAELGSTVLKVGHHGSDTSSTREFLDAVRSEIAVISAGEDNQYGHPEPEVVRRLEESVGEESIFRTDLAGTIELVSDGERLWVETER